MRRYLRADTYAPRSHMCFEKQHVKWLLETHVAFRGEDGWRIFVITDFHRLHPRARDYPSSSKLPGLLGCCYDHD